MALLRVALVPVVAARPDRRRPSRARQRPVRAAAGCSSALWAVGLLVAHALAARGAPAPGCSAWRASSRSWTSLALGALTYTSGGPYSEARLAFFALPLVAAFRLRPALTAAWTAAAIAVYVLISLPHPATRTGADVDAIVAHALYLAWAGAGAVVLSALLGARDRRMRAARRRTRPAGRPGAHRRGARAPAPGGGAARRRDPEPARWPARSCATTTAATTRTPTAAPTRRWPRRVDQLRGEIFELHPYVLDHAGLRAALTAHAESAARRAGARAEVEVDDAAPGRGTSSSSCSRSRASCSPTPRGIPARSTIGLRLTSDRRTRSSSSSPTTARLRARAARAGAARGPHRHGHQRRARRRGRRQLRRRLRARRRHDDHRATAARRPAAA